MTIRGASVSESVSTKSLHYAGFFVKRINTANVNCPRLP
jgi:hypothetical protein